MSIVPNSGLKPLAYVTTQDIVIPAGTELTGAPWRIVRSVPFVDAIIGHGPDTTSIWSIDLQEAVALGLVAEREIAA
jgi:hypothetical protein